MNKGEIISRLTKESATLRSLDVAALRLFGSAATGTETSESDVDFLVEFSGPATFDRYMNLKLHLEQILGVPIDLVTEAALRPELRDIVERTSVRVA